MLTNKITNNFDHKVYKMPRHKKKKISNKKKMKQKKDKKEQISLERNIEKNILEEEMERNSLEEKMKQTTLKDKKDRTALEEEIEKALLEEKIELKAFEEAISTNFYKRYEKYQINNKDYYRLRENEVSFREIMRSKYSYDAFHIIDHYEKHHGKLKVAVSGNAIINEPIDTSVKSNDAIQIASRRNYGYLTKLVVEKSHMKFFRLPIETASLLHQSKSVFNYSHNNPRSILAVNSLKYGNDIISNLIRKRKIQRRRYMKYRSSLLN